MTLPPDIQQLIFETLNGDKTPLEFEAWLYADTRLEKLLPPEEYLELISFGYKSPTAKYELPSLLERFIDKGEWETWRLRSLLTRALQRDEQLPHILITFYDLYCKGYTFLSTLGLEYGLTVKAPSAQEDWNDLTPKKQQQLLASFYPQLEVEIKKVLHWLDTWAIILTGNTNTYGRYDDYTDSRIEDEKGLTEYQPDISKESTIDTKHLEGKRVFWSNKWDKLWLLIIPAGLLIETLTTDRYSPFWFWTIVIGASAFISYVLYHMFHPKFAWIDPSTTEGRKLEQLAFKLRLNDEGIFEYTTEGFTVSQDNNNRLIRWTDITTIFAYKLDLMTVDELHMDVFAKDGTKLHFSEEYAGWHQFIEKTKEMLPNIDKEFEAKLIFPPFETNLTLVYDSAGRTAEEAQKVHYPA
jgi:hypothetical protein